MDIKKNLGKEIQDAQLWDTYSNRAIGGHFSSFPAEDSPVSTFLLQK